MKQRRILYVVNHAGFFISHRLPLALAARAAGYEVHVATPKSKHVPQILAAELAWHPLPLSRSAINPFVELRTFIELYRLYRRLGPDLVHHVTTKPVLYGSIAARLAGVPAVVNAISGLGYAFASAGRARRLFGRAIAAAYGLALGHPNSRVIFQNREQLTQFVNERRVDEAQAVLIPGSGVDMTVFGPSSRPPNAIPHVVLASRMLYTKGVQEFVDAARLLRSRGVNARFMLVGEPDPDNPESIPIEVLDRWNTEGIVSYAGRRNDMPDVLAGTDVFVLPTYYGEGVPKALIEAAACGVAIVTTDWPGCRDVVVDEVNGMLVPVRDVIRLADAIERLARDPVLRADMGAKGRARATENFALPAVVDQTLKIYEDLLR
jgi:glycosyltransferase involved in cell wall biosynthesis